MRDAKPQPHSPAVTAAGTLAKRSRLTARKSATNRIIREWVDLLAARIRRQLGASTEIEGFLLPYRSGGKCYFACDFADGRGQTYPLVFSIGEAFVLDNHDPQIPDAAEIIHICGLLASALKARVAILV